MIHTDPHPLAGEMVEIRVNGEILKFDLQDWWDRAHGKSWMLAEGNPAAITYAVRSGIALLPIDNEVVYGKVGCFGHLIHVSEIVTQS
ncbi:hypothetical protein ACT89R_01825 [Rhodococcus qingshengii]